MKTSLNIKNKLTMISEMVGDSIFQILEYEDLKGSSNIITAIKLNELRKAGMRLKQVRIYLNNSSVILEKGALSYLRGNIEISNHIDGPISLGKKLFASRVTGESTFKPQYTGIGEIFLEPSFGHYALVELEDDEIIIDDGLFYACENSVNIGVVRQKSISSMMLGNEGVFQTKLSGSGIVVLELPVPESEIFKCKINRDTLKVDGNFSILRMGDIEFTVEKSTKSIIGTATSGEGLLNVFRGTGEIWLVPTKITYDKISKCDELEKLNITSNSSNTNKDI